MLSKLVNKTLYLECLEFLLNTVLKVGDLYENNKNNNKYYSVIYVSANYVSSYWKKCINKKILKPYKKQVLHIN